MALQLDSMWKRIRRQSQKKYDLDKVFPHLLGVSRFYQSCIPPSEPQLRVWSSATTTTTTTATTTTTTTTNYYYYYYY